MPLDRAAFLIPPLETLFIAEKPVSSGYQLEFYFLELRKFAE